MFDISSVGNLACSVVTGASNMGSAVAQSICGAINQGANVAAKVASTDLSQLSKLSAQAIGEVKSATVALS